MSESGNVGTIRQIYADFGEGNISGVLDSLTEDVVWVEPEAGKSPVSGVARGRQEVAEFFRVLDDVSETEAFEPREFVAQDNKVVVLGYYRFRVKATGKRWESEWAMAFTFRHGLIAHFQFYGDTLGEAAAFA